MMDAVGTKGAVDRAVARVLAATAVTPTPAATSSASTPADVAQLGGVSAQLAADAPVDADRVQQIKKAIANGTFPILPATVADRLLAVRYEWMTDDQA
ncbi:flagellar biosynthesis anti-sigma factor FlgM [Sphingomonas bacterium]|uniref:flagellar biosynthesis anti-sigma factor FlgM n=1 Tax=Sphingomonas bacterium TaxID=1895847 RepID=UPI0020C5ECD8|nr:flagellar biosynthesis anti-sigma factor FlgM [Sphingomonas bacterium]